MLDCSAYTGVPYGSSSVHSFTTVSSSLSGIRRHASRLLLLLFLLLLLECRLAADAGRRRDVRRRLRGLRERALRGREEERLPRCPGYGRQWSKYVRVGRSTSRARLYATERFGRGECRRGSTHLQRLRQHDRQVARRGRGRLDSRLDAAAEVRLQLEGAAVLMLGPEDERLIRSRGGWQGVPKRQLEGKGADQRRVESPAQGVLEEADDRPPAEEGPRGV